MNQYLSDYPVVVVKAWATWCEPCKTASKNLNILIQTLQDTYPTVFQSQVDTHQRPLMLFLDDNIDEESVHRDRVSVVPTFFIYSSINGQNKLQTYTNIEFPDVETALHQLCQQLSL